MEHYVYLCTDPSRSEPIYVGLRKGKKPETKQKRVDGQVARWADPAARERKAAQMRAYWARVRAAKERS